MQNYYTTLNFDNSTVGFADTLNNTWTSTIAFNSTRAGYDDNLSLTWILVFSIGTVITCIIFAVCCCYKKVNTDDDGDEEEIGVRKEKEQETLIND